MNSRNQPRNNSIAFTNSRSECCQLITVSNRITSHFFLYLVSTCEIEKKGKQAFSELMLLYIEIYKY